MTMVNFGFLVKNKHGDDFDVNWGFDFRFVVFLIAFKCILTNKQVWGTNLGQRGSKFRFLERKWMGSWEETQEQCFLFWWSSPSELIASSCRVAQLINPCFGCSGYSWVDPEFPKRFFWCI